MIKFCKQYSLDPKVVDTMEVLHTSGKIITYHVDDLPKTVKTFLMNCQNIKVDHSDVFNRDYILYS